MTLVLYGINGPTPIQESFPSGKELQEFLKENPAVITTRVEEVPPYGKRPPKPTLYMGGDEDLEDQRSR